MRLVRPLLALALAVATSASATAADNAVFGRAMRPPVVFETYLVRVLSPMRFFMRNLATENKALVVAKIAAYHRKSERGWVRTVNAAMRADTDGNDRLDRSELGRGGVPAEKIDELFRLFGKGEDGAVSRHELNTVSEPLVAAARLLLDVGDGDEVRLPDLLDQAIGAFRAVDTDGDLEISVAEFQAAFGDAGEIANEPRVTRDTVTRLLINLLRDTSNMTLPPGSLDCAMPRPSPEAEVVLVGVIDGAALSDVYVGSPEKQTTTAEIAIKAGREPLYIILSAIEPMIWRLTGATDRVERIVLAGPERARSGVVGLPVDKLALADGDDRDICVPLFHNIDPPEASAIGDRIAAATGQRPDRMAATTSAARLLVTSMDFVDAPASQRALPSGFEPDEWRGALQFAPAGMVSIDPGQVAALAPAARYDVLPIKRRIAEFFGSGPPRWLSESAPTDTAKPKLYVPDESATAPRGKFGIRLGVQAP